LKKSISFTIPLTPTGQMRPRFSSQGKFKRAYKAEKQERREVNALFYIQDIAPPKPLSGPLSVRVLYYMPRPKSHYGTGKNSTVLKKNAPLYHVFKPDIDNLNKFVYDILNKLIWLDDSQVCIETSEKIYSVNPRTEVYIEVLNNGEAKNKSDKRRVGCGI